MKPQEPVAVSGVGCLCAAGLDLPSCMDFLFRGERFPSPPTVFPDADPEGPPVFRIEPDFWRPGDFREAANTRTARLTLTAAAEALADAGLDRETLRRRRVGVCLGTNSAGAVSNAALAECAPVPDGEYRTPAQRYATGSPALALAREYDLAGPVETVVTACSAGTDAIGLAAAWIRMGLCDLVITGGADELYEITYTGFASLMNTDPGPCKPFDANRNGLTLGEGAGVMILESAESLRERGQSARGAIRGYGNAGDAFHLTSPEPDGRGLRLSISEALSGAGLSDRFGSPEPSGRSDPSGQSGHSGPSARPDRLDRSDRLGPSNPAEPGKPGDLAFINAHGTGTRDNDRIESLLFADLFPGTPFLSTKGFTGHTLGAAGAVEAIFSIGCLERGAVPPNAGFRTPDPELPNAPVSEVTEIRGKTALSQTLAFGGNNAVLVVSAGAEVPE